MNMFSFVRFFQSDKDIQLAFPQLQERISTELSVKHSCIENNKLCFTLQQQNVLFRNAFLPKVEMRVETDTTNTKLYVRFMLQKFVQVFMLIYFVLAGLLEIAMISIFLIGNLSSPLFCRSACMDWITFCCTVCNKAYFQRRLEAKRLLLEEKLSAELTDEVL